MRKKVLILGGASVHVKLVDSAHNLGLYVIVTDFLDKRNSPAKQIADESWDIDVKDTERLAAKCRENEIAAVLSTHLDPCQRPYFTLCNALGLPCYGTYQAFMKMTDKQLFKEMCKRNGVGVIEEYSIDDIMSGNVSYPVFVKPVDSRGSRGQFVCHTKEKALAAIEDAKKESSNGKYIVERFIENAQEVQMTYFVINRTPYLIRSVDSFRGRSANMEKVVLCAISPSESTDRYLESCESNVRKMIRELDISFGPVFMQGFFDGLGFKFFDPGLRFPGVDFELILKKVFKVDILESLWKFALGEDIPKMEPPEGWWKIRGLSAAVLFPTMKAGRICGFSGLDYLERSKAVISYSLRHGKGEEVGWSYNVNQRYAEVDMVADSIGELRRDISSVLGNFYPVDEAGNSLALETVIFYD